MHGNSKNNYSSSFNWLYRSYIRNARKRNLIFELDRETFYDLTQNNCYYCGVEPQQVIKHSSYKGIYIYNGIDRIDNTKGYVAINCVSCCKSCNYMKSKMNSDGFIKKIFCIYEYINRREDVI